MSELRPSSYPTGSFTQFSDHQGTHGRPKFRPEYLFEITTEEYEISDDTGTVTALLGLTLTKFGEFCATNSPEDIEIYVQENFDRYPSDLRPGFLRSEAQALKSIGRFRHIPIKATTGTLESVKVVQDRSDPTVEIVGTLEQEDPWKSGFSLKFGENSTVWAIYTDLGGDSFPARAVSWSPSGDYIALSVGEEDEPGEVFIHDADTQAVVESWTTDVTPDSVKFSPNGDWLAYTDDDELIVRDVATWSVEYTELTPDRTNAIDWSADGQYLAFTGRYSDVLVRETATWDTVVDTFATYAWTEDLSFSDNGQWIAVPGENVVSILEVGGNWSEIATLEKDIGTGDPWIISCRFSPGSEYVAFGAADSKLHVYRTSDWSLVDRFQEGAWPFSITFSHGGEYIAYGDGWAGNIKIREVGSFDLVETIPDANLAFDLDFSPDNSKMVSAAEWWRAIIYDTPVEPPAQDGEPAVAAAISVTGSITPTKPLGVAESVSASTIPGALVASLNSTGVSETISSAITSQSLASCAESIGSTNVSSLSNPAVSQATPITSVEKSSAFSIGTETRVTATPITGFGSSVSSVLALSVASSAQTIPKGATGVSMATSGGSVAQYPISPMTASVESLVNSLASRSIISNVASEASVESFTVSASDPTVAISVPSIAVSSVSAELSDLSLVVSAVGQSIVSDETTSTNSSVSGVTASVFPTSQTEIAGTEATAGPVKSVANVLSPIGLSGATGIGTLTAANTGVLASTVFSGSVSGSVSPVVSGTALDSGEFSVSTVDSSVIPISASSSLSGGLLEVASSASVSRAYSKPIRALLPTFVIGDTHTVTFSAVPLVGHKFITVRRANIGDVTPNGVITNRTGAGVSVSRSKSTVRTPKSTLSTHANPSENSVDVKESE